MVELVIMNPEKMSEILSNPQDIENLLEEINEESKKAREKIKNGEAYYVDEYKDGKLKTLKVFSNDGTLIFFKDFGQIDFLGQNLIN